MKLRYRERGASLIGGAAGEKVNAARGEGREPRARAACTYARSPPRRGITRCNGNQAQPLATDWYIRSIGSDGSHYLDMLAEHRATLFVPGPSCLPLSLPPPPALADPSRHSSCIARSVTYN